MKLKKISSAYISLIVFLLFISWNNSAKAIPMAPPMCEVEATINKIEPTSKTQAIGSIKIFSSQNANYASYCDTYLGAVLDGLEIGIYDASYNRNKELLVPGTKIKGFLMLPNDRALSKDMSGYYLDAATVVDKFYGANTNNTEISKVSNRNFTITIFVIPILLVALLLFFYFRKKYKFRKQ